MVRATRAILSLLVAPLLLSCGPGGTVFGPALGAAAGMPSPEGELEVRPSERERPSLRLSFPYAHAEALLGFGTVHLWARPELDEIRVSAIVDAPSKGGRWSECSGAVLMIDGRPMELAASYVGVPMQAGVYDAVRLDLGVHELRRVARARRVAGSVCGDPIEISAAQRRTLARFVGWFDRIAAPSQNEDAPGFREVGPSIPLLPNEDDDPGPHPA